MTHLQEVPTDELLSFQDYPTVHNPNGNTTHSLSSVQIGNESFENVPKKGAGSQDMNPQGIL